MSTKLAPPVAAYIRATNNQDAAAFIACFADSAVVNDAGREFCGIPAIKAWSDEEIIAAKVTFEVLKVDDRDGGVAVITKWDGNYDKTGLPDPLILDHQIMVADDKIAALTIRLADEKSKA
jgi:hypothetical protein